MFVCMTVSTNDYVFMYVCMYVCVDASTYACKCVHAYKHTNMHTYFKHTQYIVLHAYI